MVFKYLALLFMSIAIIQNIYAISKIYLNSGKIVLDDFIGFILNAYIWFYVFFSKIN